MRVEDRTNGEACEFLGFFCSYPKVDGNFLNLELTGELKIHLTGKKGGGEKCLAISSSCWWQGLEKRLCSFIPQKSDF